MKFFLASLLSSHASVDGQVMPPDGSSVTPMPAPEMVIFYVNEEAAATVCTERELLYIDRKLPDFDMTLLTNNFETPQWDVIANPTRRNLASASCDWCRTLYPRNLCNAMYNCSFRRNNRYLRTNGTVPDAKILSSDFLQSCQDNISMLSQSRYLSQSCKIAIGAAVCHVDFF